MVKSLIERMQKNEFLAQYINDQTIGQFKRYLVTGFTSFGLEYSIFLLCYKAIRLSDLMSNSIALGIIFWFNFLMNRIWAFKSKESLKKQLIQYGVLFVFNLGMTNLLMYVFSHILTIPPQLSKVLIMGFVVMWNFILYKKVIYKT